MASRKRSTKVDKVLCIDADSAVYACGFIAEKKTHYAIVDGKPIATYDDKRKYNKWFKTLTTEEQEAITYDYVEHKLPEATSIQAIDKWVHDLMKLAGSTRKIVLLTKGGACFRTYRATLKKYKGNRDSMKKPEHYQAIRNHLKKKHKAKTYAKWEADDAACMFMHASAGKPDQKAILAAIDKDLEQQIGQHVNPNKKDEGVYFVDEREGALAFYTQMLVGDVADNIPGLKGVGAKHKWVDKLAECETSAEMCLHVYGCYIIKHGDNVTYQPWWWDEKYNDPEYHDADLVQELREQRPDKEVTVPTVEVFRENADLLYMLRYPDDQYIPEAESVAELIKPYKDGIVKEMLGDK
jgi:hypothetical protein